MLSAKKEDKRPAAIFTVPDLSNEGHLGRVADSIQSLRERLQSISVEEMIEADEKLKTLLARLLALQKALTRLSEMKQYIAKANSTKEQMAAETFDTGNARNLIPFPSLSRLPKDPIQSGSVSSSVKKQERTDSDESAFEFFVLDRRSEEGQSFQTGRQTNSVTESGSPVEQTADLASKSSTEGIDRIRQFATDEQKSKESSVNKSHDPTPPQSDASQIVETRGAAVGPAENIQLDSTDDPNTAERSVGNELDFDQRLLHDLIKNYGEFVGSPALPAASETEDASGHTNKRKSHSSAAPRSQESPGIRNLPIHKREGDLDQKLKKLIKDYGEYDLYSQQTPSKLRTAVLAAFLMLAVVFPAIYFLSGPKSIDRSSHPSATESEYGSDAASRGSLKATEIDGAALPKRAGSASVETQSTTETNESNAIKNKAVSKKKSAKAGPPS